MPEFFPAVSDQLSANQTNESDRSFTWKQKGRKGAESPLDFGYHWSDMYHQRLLDRGYDRLAFKCIITILCSSHPSDFRHLFFIYRWEYRAFKAFEEESTLLL